MIKNYIITTIRHLIKNKSHTAINVFGLSVGLASCLIIFLYLRNEISFDQFHEKHDRIYRVTNTFERSSGSIFWARTPPALAPGIRNNISGIDAVTRMRYADDHVYSVGEKIFNQGNVFYADSMFLQLFDFQLKSGNRTTVLSSPNTIVITEEMAIKYFGDEDPLGKAITFDNNLSLMVTGVLETVPATSHITFDMLISFETFSVPEGYLSDLNGWSWAGFHTYALLRPNADPKSINDQIIRLYNENFNRANISAETELQPLSSIYLESNKYTNVGESIRIGNKSTIYSLSVVAVLILVIASFNFINLSTALSLGRGKEIGIRKVMGAPKEKIAYQFLVESVIISFISLFVALLFISLSQLYFEEKLGIQLPTFWEYAKLLPVFILAALTIGLLAGSYPSIAFSSFGPIVALRGNLKTGKSGVAFRNGMIVFQSIISLLLMAGSMVIVSQMDYIRNRSLGFNKEHILKIKVLNEDMAQHYISLKNRFEQYTQIVNVSMSSHSLDGGSSSGPARLLGASEDESYQLAYYQVDEDFMDLMGIELVEGRFFSKDFSTDSSAMIMNEAAVNIMELENPIGAKIIFADAERTLIGVVKDFHFNSLHMQIAPMAIIRPFTNTELMLVKIAPRNIAETLAVLNAEWNDIVGDSPFDATFLDDGIQQMYLQEEKLSDLIYLFSALAVILTCLGLYGLISFSIRSKLKEVSIRKVFGASVAQLLVILSKKFVLLIVIANLISWPLIYLFGNMWLDNFAYRIDMSWWAYASSGIILLSIAILTTGHQTISAALTNPAKVLRDE